MNLTLIELLEAKYGVTKLKPIGNGAFGDVFSAKVFEVPRAIKVSRDVLDKRLLAMADQELEFMKKPAIKACPTIVPLIAVWRELGHLITVWDLGEQSLAERLADCREQELSGIPSQELERHLRDAASALDVINALGIRHRDIKPENIILMDGHAKIIDLGLAIFTGASSMREREAGTPGYIAPEAYDDSQHGKVTQTIDIYALAATAIKLTTGSDPFGSNHRVILSRQEAGTPEIGGLASHQVNAVLSALHPDPKQRGFTTATEFVEAFFGSSVKADIAPRETVTPPPKASENRLFSAASTVDSVIAMVNSHILKGERDTAFRKLMAEIDSGKSDNKALYLLGARLVNNPRRGDEVFVQSSDGKRLIEQFVAKYPNDYRAHLETALFLLARAGTAEIFEQSKKHLSQARRLAGDITEVDWWWAWWPRS